MSVYRSSELTNDHSYRIASEIYEDLRARGYAPETVLSAAAFLRTRADIDARVAAAREARETLRLETDERLRAMQKAVVR